MMATGNFQALIQEQAFAHGGPLIQAQFKRYPEDFEVEEWLDWQPSGAGEHLMLYIARQGLSTAEVARRLAQFLQLPRQAISYAGLKDRQALSRQWFSIHLPGREDPALSALESGPEPLRIEQQLRNHRKLRRGGHQGNRFRIRLRNVSGPVEALDQRLETIRREGVPNYFGEQRFGHGAANVEQAARWFAGQYRPRGRNERGLLLSAARSFLFNALLSRRVADGSWNQALPGERMMLAGSNSSFAAEDGDAALEARLASGDIHPSGPLWGRGSSGTQGTVQALENEVLAQWPVLQQGLEARGLQQARRSLRLFAGDLHCARSGADLLLHFSLPPGAYATTVLRELYTGIKSSE